MRNYKSFIASVSISASTLAFVAVSAPVQALTPGGGFGCTWCSINGGNGVSLNGFRANGFKINGVRMNGPIFQGISLNGPILQGIQLQVTQFVGTRRGEPVAVTLPGGETVDLH